MLYSNYRKQMEEDWVRVGENNERRSKALVLGSEEDFQRQLEKQTRLQKKKGGLKKKTEKRERYVLRGGVGAGGNWGS